MNHIAVIGASSMVGSRFCELIKNPLIKTDLKGEIQLDITSKDSVSHFFKNHQFEWAILFSAFTNVDEAEKQRGDKNSSCWQTNVEGTKNIAANCKKYGRHLIFISTDFVFDGSRGPYDEEDPSGPDFSKVSWYGITKAEAERVVKDYMDDFLIIRIAYPYRGPYRAKDDFAKNILRLHKKNRLHPMFTDQITTPTFVDDTAKAVETLIGKGEKGIFHLASPTASTPYDFAKNLLTVFNKNIGKLKRGSILEFLRKENSTPRPVKGGLKVDKIKRIGLNPTDWRQGIKVIYEQARGKLI